MPPAPIGSILSGFLPNSRLFNIRSYVIVLCEFDELRSILRDEGSCFPYESELGAVFGRKMYLHEISGIYCESTIQKSSAVSSTKEIQGGVQLAAVHDDIWFQLE